MKSDYLGTGLFTALIYCFVVMNLVSGNSKEVLIFFGICAGIGAVISLGVVLSLTFLKRGITNSTRGIKLNEEAKVEVAFTKAALTGSQWSFAILFTLASTLALPVAIQFMLYDFDFKEMVPDGF
jgi:phosphoribosylformylglycinamidine (FGAM) synthase-like amidotransferase family enzyme